MNVYLFVCLNICLFEYLFVRLFICLNKHLCICVFVHLNKYTNAQNNKCTNTQIHIQSFHLSFTPIKVCSVVLLSRSVRMGNIQYMV